MGLQPLTGRLDGKSRQAEQIETGYRESRKPPTGPLSTRKYWSAPAILTLLEPQFLACRRGRRQRRGLCRRHYRHMAGKADSSQGSESARRTPRGRAAADDAGTAAGRRPGMPKPIIRPGRSLGTRRSWRWPEAHRLCHVAVNRANASGGRAYAQRGVATASRRMQRAAEHNIRRRIRRS